MACSSVPTSLQCTYLRLLLRAQGPAVRCAVRASESCLRIDTTVVTASRLIAWRQWIDQCFIGVIAYQRWPNHLSRVPLLAKAREELEQPLEASGGCSTLVQSEDLCDMASCKMLCLHLLTAKKHTKRSIFPAMSEQRMLRAVGAERSKVVAAGLAAQGRDCMVDLLDESTLILGAVELGGYPPR